MNLIKMLLACLVAGTLTFAAPVVLTGCGEGERTPTEEGAEEGAEDMADEAEDAANEAGDAAEEAADEAQDAADEAQQAAEDAADELNY